MSYLWRRLFTYQTEKVVRVSDYRLAVAYWIIILLIFAYVGGFVFYHQRGYALKQQSEGRVAVKVKGITYSQTTVPGQTEPVILPWDASELQHPAVEDDAVFIASYVEVTPNQTVGICEDLERPCKVDADCTVNDGVATVSYEYVSSPLNIGTCMPSGYCALKQYCPPEDLKNKLKRNTTVTYKIASPDSVTIWIRGNIRFSALDPKVVYSTVTDATPIPYNSSSVSAQSRSQPNPNLYTLRELLNLMETGAPNLADIYRYGAIVTVVLEWECWIYSPCFPLVKTLRLDNATLNNGFNFRETFHSTIGGVRELRKYTGIRILLSSSGIGYKTDAIPIILQLASTFALMAFARIVVDFLMILHPDRKRYQEVKYEEDSNLVGRKFSLKSDSMAIPMEHHVSKTDSLEL